MLAIDLSDYGGLVPGKEQLESILNEINNNTTIQESSSSTASSDSLPILVELKPSVITTSLSSKKRVTTYRIGHFCIWFFNYIFPCTFQTMIEREPFSGSHDHDDSERLIGEFDIEEGVTNSFDDVFVQEYTAPEVAGDVIYTTTFSAPGLGTDESKKLIRVLEQRFSVLGPDAYYDLIGSFGMPGVSSMHIKNHYATSGFNTGLKNLAMNYHEAASRAKLLNALRNCQSLCLDSACEAACQIEVEAVEYPNEILSINDMSLPWGGVFDIENDWRKNTTCTNSSGADSLCGHSAHRWGQEVDIRRPQNGDEARALLDVAGKAGYTHFSYTSHFHFRKF